jgi:hypothetical protein
MSNLYSVTRSQEAMRRLFRVKRDLTGNLPSLPNCGPMLHSRHRRAANPSAKNCSAHTHYEFARSPELFGTGLVTEEISCDGAAVMTRG